MKQLCQKCAINEKQVLQRGAGTVRGGTPLDLNRIAVVENHVNSLGETMNKLILPILFLAGDCLAHPGHGAPPIHLHELDWIELTLIIAVFAMATLAVLRSKK